MLDYVRNHTENDLATHVAEARKFMRILVSRVNPISHDCFSQCVNHVSADSLAWLKSDLHENVSEIKCSSRTTLPKSAPAESALTALAPLKRGGGCFSQFLRNSAKYHQREFRPQRPKLISFCPCLSADSDKTRLASQICRGHPQITAKIS